MALAGSPVITTASAPSMGAFNRYDATAGSLTVTLPALLGINVPARLAVQKYLGDVSAHTVTFNCAGTDKFDDGTTTSLPPLIDAGDQYELQVISISGTKRWKIVGTQLSLGTGTDRIGVVAVDAPTGVAATDTAAIQAAHDALPTRGGKILVPSGDELLTAAGLTFAKRVVLIGTGRGIWDGSSVSSTLLLANSATATAVTISAAAAGSSVENLVLDNMSASDPTAGYGLKFANAQNSYVSHAWIHGYYDNLRIEGGCYYYVSESFFNAPVRYGIFVSNASAPDAGDAVIHAVGIDATGSARTSSTAGIRWESGGGLRISDSKIVGQVGQGQFQTGIDFAVADGVTTSDLFVQGTSIENTSGTHVKFERAGTTGVVQLVQVQNSQFQGPTPTIIAWGPGYSGGLMSGNVSDGNYTDTTGAVIRNGSGSCVVGENLWLAGVITPVHIESGASPDTYVARQHRIGDGLLFVDESAGARVGAMVDNRTQRGIEFTVNATPQALWTMGVADYAGGLIEVTVSGVHQGTGGFVASQRVAYVVDASGVVTLTTIDTILHGTTGVQLTFTTSANTVVAKIATADAQDVYSGRADLDVKGKLASLKVGA